ncbi:MAG: ABC transporter ATP-binding protein [Bdellovibrionales bacterium]
MKVIQVEDLKKSYRKGFFKRRHPVLKGLSFQVEAGKITGFLGSNGAGKTTTLKCLLNLSIPDSGKIHFFEQGPLTPSLCEKIGFLPERPYFYEYLTGYEFLRFYGELSTRLKRADLDQQIRMLLKRVRLEHASDRALRTYSKGMLQRVGLAQALIHEPQLVILDEPVAGMDPDGRMEMAQIIRETAQKGSAVFFSSHLLHDAETLCDDLVIIRQGELAYNGSTQKLLHSLQSGFRLTYVEKDHPVTQVFHSDRELQEAIDRVRSQKGLIQEVKAERPSLESAFAKIISQDGSL